MAAPLQALARRLPRVSVFYDPLSSIAVPLVNGLLRRWLLRRGVREEVTRCAGAALTYYAAGPAVRPGGPMPILLVHGLGDSAMTWAIVLYLLAREHPVFAVDLPGYGLSSLPPGRTFATLDEMTAMLRTFIETVIGQPALIVGNSMGGWLAVRLAWAAPKLVRGVVLINAGGAPLEGHASWDPFAEAVAMRDPKRSHQVIRQIAGPPGALALLFAQRSIEQIFRRQVVRDFVAAADENIFLRSDDLRNLPVPAALMWGLRDRFLPAGSLEFFHENLPGAPALLLRGCGHLPQRERPLAVWRFVRRYAASLAAHGQAPAALTPRTLME
jgi:pimeloyl-ACP methyl ester carboxylesterase